MINGEHNGRLQGEILSQPGLAIPALVGNPFHVLAATTVNTRAEISELAERASLTRNSQAVTEARRILTHPRLRLDAELGWVSNADRRAASEILQLVDILPSANLFNHLSPLGRANVRSWLMEKRYRNESSQDWQSRDLPELLKSIDAVKPDEVKRTLDRDREIAGFPQTDLRQVTESLHNQRRSWIDIALSALRAQSLEKRADTLASIVESCAYLSSVDDVVDIYEEHDAAQEVGDFETFIDTLMSAQRQNSPFLRTRLSQLKYRIDAYGRLVRPIVSSWQQRGLKHALTYKLVDSVQKVVSQTSLEELSFSQRIALVYALRTAAYPIQELRDELTIQLQNLRAAETTARKPVAPQSPQPKSNSAAGPPQFAPSSKNPATFGGKILRWVVGIIVFAVIGSVLGNLNDDTGTANESGSSLSASQKCAGMDDWWEATNDRVDEANAIVMTIDSYSSNSEVYAAQRDLEALAQQQQASHPPLAAVKFNLAQQRLLNHMAYGFTNDGFEDTTWDDKLDSLNSVSRREADKVGETCRFKVIHEEDQ